MRILAPKADCAQAGCSASYDGAQTDRAPPQERIRLLARARRSRLVKQSRGFSLIEITIAVAIVATLTALATVQLAPASEKMRVEAEAREIANILGNVRTRALTSGQPTAVTIDAAENRLIYGTPALERRLPATLALDVAPDGDGRRIRRIVFYPEGSASGGAFALAGRNHRVSVSVNWLTARITIGPEAANGG